MGVEDEEAASSKGERPRPAGCVTHLAWHSSKIFEPRKTRMDAKEEMNLNVEEDELASS
jgi:hypothetical protein